MSVGQVSSNAPIFIVGPPRSGTSLLSAIIGSHSRIACGPETDLFNALPLEEISTQKLGENWPKRAIEQLEAITYPDGNSLSHHFGLTIEQLEGHLSAQRFSAQSIYAAIPACFAAAQEKPRWAEKTPRHLLYVQSIRELFPDAKIIRIVRDPRDSVPSVIKNIGLSTSLIGEFYRWAAIYEESNPFFLRDRNCITVKYEDLVLDAEKEISRICGFLGEEFEREMLKRKAADNVRVASEVWKRDIDKKITAENIFGWKKRLDPDIARAASLICCEALEQLGYPDPLRPVRELTVYPLSENFGVANELHIVHSAKTGFRYRASTLPYPQSMGDALKHYPDTMLGDLPLGKGPATRIWRCVVAIGGIFLRFLLRNPVKVDPNIQLGVGSLNRLIGKVALLLGSPRSFTK